MKKLLFSTMAILAFTQISTAKEGAVKDCKGLAVSMLEIQESYFGCLESSDYNFLYTNIVGMCEQNMPISGLIH